MRRITAARDIMAVRVLVGPKKLGKGFARIVAQKDGSGRIESFNLTAGKWLEAPPSITFTEVWSAPAVPFNLLHQIIESD